MKTLITTFIFALMVFAFNATPAYALGGGSGGDREEAPGPKITEVAVNPVTKLKDVVDDVPPDNETNTLIPSIPPPNYPVDTVFEHGKCGQWCWEYKSNDDENYVRLHYGKNFTRQTQFGEEHFDYFFAISSNSLRNQLDVIGNSKLAGEYIGEALGLVRGKSDLTVGTAHATVNSSVTSIDFFFDFGIAVARFDNVVIKNNEDNMIEQRGPNTNRYIKAFFDYNNNILGSFNEGQSGDVRGIFGATGQE